MQQRRLSAYDKLLFVKALSTTHTQTGWDRTGRVEEAGREGGAGGEQRDQSEIPHTDTLP